MTALQALPSILRSNEVAALRDFLIVPYEIGTALKPREFNGLKNTAADILLRQPDLPADLLADFAAMHADPAYDVIWRDYCLQFLAAGHEVLEDRADPEAVEARGLAVRTLLEATSDRMETFSGTALLGLESISRRVPEAVQPQRVAGLAAEVAGDEQASEACRITALRVAGLTGASAVLPMARELAQTGATEMLRQAAVATIGELGAAEDQELLDALAHDPDKYVAATAAKARQALAKRAGDASLTEAQRPQRSEVGAL